jgi:hypothetical protein
MKLRSFFTATLVAAGALLASAGLAGAAAISDVNQVSNFTESDYGDIGWTSVASHPNGNSLVVYFGYEVEDGSSDDSVGYHYTQLIGPDGARLTDPVRVGPSESSYYYAAPAVAYNPVTDGWSVFLIPLYEDIIVHQAVNTDGSLDGSATTVWERDESIVFSQANASWIASENHFLFSVVAQYVDPITPGNDDTQWITFTIDSDGTRIAGPTVVGDVNYAYVNGQAAYSPTSNRALLVTVGNVESGDEYAPFGQLVDGNGARVGNTIRLIPNADADQVSGAGVAWNSSTNQFLVVWSSSRWNNCTDDARGCGMWGQLVNPDGTLSGPRLTFYSTTDTSQDFFRPQVTANGASNEYVIVWHMGPYWTEGTNVWSLRVDGAGAPIGDAMDVSESEGGEYSVHQRPAVAFNNQACAYVVTWQGVPDNRIDLQHIYSRTIEAGLTCTLPSTGMGQTTTLVALAMMAAGALAVQTGRRRRLA